jgi:mRNA interferase HicA
VNRRRLVRHLEQHGCYLEREGSSHSIFVNPANEQSSAVPRHREIETGMALKICKQLRIPRPTSIQEEEAIYGTEYD